jgi:HEAT repeat protein
VAIRASASLEVRRLLGDLEGEDPVRRDAAVARLAVIGTRAVRQILEHLAATSVASARASLLMALESITDPRAVEPVLAALTSEDAVVRVAAIRAARGLLSLPQGTRVLDRLTALALNPGRPGPERAVALDALGALPARTMRPLLDKLRDDPSREVRDVVAQAGLPVDDPVAELEEAADGWLARDPDAVVHLVSRAAADAPLSTLHRLIEKVRSKESEGRPARRRDWGTVRGALHIALARRASKVALYDLREAFERSTDPLPPDYVTAMGLVGDASCLEPLAVAFVQAHTMEDADVWRRDVAAVFRGIVKREGLTRRHGPIRRVRARFRNEVDELLR